MKIQCKPANEDNDWDTRAPQLCQHTDKARSAHATAPAVMDHCQLAASHAHTFFLAQSDNCRLRTQPSNVPPSVATFVCVGICKSSLKSTSSDTLASTSLCQADLATPTTATGTRCVTARPPPAASTPPRRLCPTGLQHPGSLRRRAGGVEGLRCVHPWHPVAWRLHTHSGSVALATSWFTPLDPLTSFRSSLRLPGSVRSIAYLAEHARCFCSPAASSTGDPTPAHP